MPKFRVVYAISFDVEAEDESEAEEKAYEMLVREIGGDAADAVIGAFGVNVEELDDDWSAFEEEDGEDYFEEWDEE